MRSFVDKKGVLFDLDGTLVDSKPGIFAAIRYTFRELQLPELSEEDMDRFIGPSIGSSFRNVCGFSDEETEQAIELFRAYFREKGLYECTVYPGLTRLLQILKEENRKVALSTKKPEIFARQILANKGILSYFDAISGADYADQTEHKDNIVRSAAQKLGLPVSECVLLGDTRFDCIGASMVGMDCIGVLYGYGTWQELCDNGAAALAENARELSVLLCEMSL